MEPDERRPDLRDADIARAVAEGRASLDSGRLIAFESEEAFRAFLDSVSQKDNAPTIPRTSAWLQSSYSPGGDQRVLVARMSDGSVLLGLAGNGATLHIPEDEWMAFVKSVQGGEFEPLAVEGNDHRT